MDDLISVLAMIAIAGISVWRKQKKQSEQAAKNARRKQGFSDMAEMEKAGKPAVSREMILELLGEQEVEGKSNRQPAAEKPEKKQKAAPQPAVQDQKKPEPVQLKMAPLPKKPAAPIVKAPAPIEKAKAAPVLFMEHDEPEGSVSTQGESAEEHALHRQKILAEEAKIRTEHEEMQELRNMNLKKLRTAVVMSEILDKPVSLRGRRF